MASPTVIRYTGECLEPSDVGDRHKQRVHENGLVLFTACVLNLFQAGGAVIKSSFVKSKPK